uniref:Uncharacterized protein n=1 Tax=Globisporangium ultimum (strain ATCC 200006 / CBS 805.95 / DAOM BR144) TaxID=431595 RepID=K3W7M4_GLOUD
MNNLYNCQAPSTPAAYQYFAIMNRIRAASMEPRCGYPSKRCDNPRAVKPTGDLHRFCEYHRKQANENQRRRERCRLEQQLREEMSMQAYMEQLSAQYFELTGQRAQEQQQQQIPGGGQLSDNLSQLDLDEEDLRVLASILLNDADEVEI